MADNSAQALIRGIDIDKLAKGFADEDNIFKNFVTVTKTAAREIRWYAKATGFLNTFDAAGIATTTGITKSLIPNTSSLSLAPVAEQSWTRNTSYVRKYFVESPWISMEDINDSDVDLLATNVRDLTRAVAAQVDTRIYRVLSDTLGTGGNASTGASTQDGWDDTITGDPIKDILTAKQTIRTNGYNPEGATIAMNPVEHRLLLEYLISVKGSSIPQFSSEKVKSGTVMEILGCNVVVSSNVPTDSVTVFVPNRAATWKQFMGITAVVVDDPGIGKKIRVWEEGECILTDPKAVYVITDTIT